MINVNRVTNAFSGVVSSILSITAAVKIWSVAGAASVTTSVFGVSDPILFLHFSTLLLVAAAVELLVVAINYFAGAFAGLLSIAWLSSVFIIYRVGLWWIGWQKPCGCLGNLTDALHISPQVADNLMKSLLAFMLIGSVSLLMLHWRRQGGASQAGSIIDAKEA